MTVAGFVVRFANASVTMASRTVWTAVNVGVRPTFATGRGLLVEAHLIGFDENIYGEILRIAFLDQMGERDKIMRE